jgi:hypothetical protein
MRESDLPLDQLHIDGCPCPFCDGTMRRDGNMDGIHYRDQCSRPWYVCDRCGEELDGDMYHGLHLH